MPKLIYFLKTSHVIKTFPDTRVTNLFQGTVTQPMFKIGATQKRQVFDFNYGSDTTILRTSIRYAVYPSGILLAPLNVYCKLILQGVGSQEIGNETWNWLTGKDLRSGETDVSFVLAKGLNNLIIEVNRDGIAGIDFFVTASLIVEYTGSPPITTPEVEDKPPDYTQLAIALSAVGLGIAGFAVIIKAWRRR